MGGGHVRHSGPSYTFSHLVPIRHWIRDPALRSWPVLLLVALVCVPPIALVLLNNPTEAKIRDIAWIFAATSPSPGCCCSASSSARSTSAGPC